MMPNQRKKHIGILLDPETGREYPFFTLAEAADIEASMTQKHLQKVQDKLTGETG